MKHFDEARRDALSATKAPALAGLFQRLCLIWDIQGRLRILADPTPGNEAALRTAIEAEFQVACEGFWSKEIWTWNDTIDQAERTVYDHAWSTARPVSAGPPELRELDRHLSKEAWFGAPLRQPWPLIIDKTPPVFSFFSFKGGVGRTTGLVATALQLALRGKNVCVIDLDLEAPGVGSLLGPAQGAPAPHGVVDYLLEQPVCKVGMPLDHYFHFFEIPAELGAAPPVTVFPAGVLDENYLEKLARVDFTRLIEADNDDLPLLALLRHIKAERKPDVIMIDSRAGLHDIGGLALNGLAHIDVLFGLDTEQSWSGLEVVVRHLGRRRFESGLRPQTCALAYAMAPGPGDPDRDKRIEEFRDRAHEIFSRDFYEEVPQNGWADPDVHWEVPAVADAGEPHYALPIAFNRDIQAARSLLAKPLIEGDYASFARDVVERIGMTL